MDRQGRGRAVARRSSVCHRRPARSVEGGARQRTGTQQPRRSATRERAGRSSAGGVPRSRSMQPEAGAGMVQPRHPASRSRSARRGGRGTVQIARARPASGRRLVLDRQRTDGRRRCDPGDPGLPGRPATRRRHAERALGADHGPDRSDPEVDRGCSGLASLVRSRARCAHRLVPPQQAR